MDNNGLTQNIKEISEKIKVLLKVNLKLKIYSDGASRGNPGPSAIAFMIVSDDNRVLKRFSEYVGIKTNNQAEYEALTYALESASMLDFQEVFCYMDSKLVVKHLDGSYRVRNSKLKPLWLKIQELKKKFQSIEFIHVSRANRYIKEVDRLANQVLDKINYSI